MKKFHLLLLSLLSGLLFSVAWPLNGFPGFLFIALVPMLFIEEQLLHQKEDHSSFTIFKYVWPGFLIWNIATTWWIHNSTLVGGIFAMLFNSLLPALVFWLFHYSRRQSQQRSTSHIVLIFYWLAYEWIHMQWDLSWPWLNLGNGFAAYPQWIQWYEYTGAFGGSLWILLSNILLFSLIKNHLQKSDSAKRASLPLALTIFGLIGGPLIGSQIIYQNYQEQGPLADVVVVQPNLDPYSEQYELPVETVTERLIDIAASRCDSLTDFVVAPESAIQEHVWEEYRVRASSLKKIKAFTDGFPDLHFVAGMSSQSGVPESQKDHPAARRFSDVDKYYFAYNTAVLINSDYRLPLYHKSKLTPGVEKMPFTRFIKPIEKLAINLGGTIGTLKTDSLRTPFSIPSKGIKVAPVICYESVYGEFVSEFVARGANLIFVITNDGWWGNTAGHKQHLSFSALRAIETRRCVARSANTGISAFFNQRGDLLQATKYWTRDAIRQQLPANNHITFYVQHGDFLARIALWFSGLMLLISFCTAFSKRKKRLMN